MSSPIFQDQKPSGGIFSMLNGLRGALADPQSLFDQMYKTNPQFRDFANSMRGKTPEEAFKEKGFDYDQVKSMLGK